MEPGLQSEVWFCGTHNPGDEGSNVRLLLRSLGLCGRSRSGILYLGNVLLCERDSDQSRAWVSLLQTGSWNQTGLASVVGQGCWWSWVVGVQI